jgi:hypothetical protein
LIVKASIWIIGGEIDNFEKKLNSPKKQISKFYNSNFIFDSPK